MKGYLLKKESINIGHPLVIESVSPENNNMVVFEDDGETGYFYAATKNEKGEVAQILDMVYIYDTGSVDISKRKTLLSIIWSRNWQQCGLVLGDVCHAVIDFPAQGAYNLAEFPPPNEVWTKQPRKLTKEMVRTFFG